MKWVGLLCIVLAGAGLGLAASGRLRQEVRICMLLQCLTEELAVYIRSQGTELPELIAFFAEEPKYRPLRFLRCAAERLMPEMSPGEVWEQAVGEDGALPADAKSILRSLGASLGKTDTEGQLAALRLHTKQLGQAEQSARDRYDTQGRLYRILGLLGGLAAAVLLI